MALEGPLRELGIHDVFQLIDLSRKSGVLRVSSELRDDEGLVYFEHGRVVKATLKSRELSGASATPAPRASTSLASKRERERQLRLQVEAVIFELMSWNEGFLSFEDSAPSAGDDPPTGLATTSLLMEGARRIDEWSRIAQVVPSVSAVPALAPVEPDRDAGGPMLDLLPHEWQVLSSIDGERDVRGIAESLGRDEFDISKIIYGLATTGIVMLRASRVVMLAEANEAASRVATAHMDAALAAVRLGDFITARESCEQVLRLAAGSDQAARAQAALDALTQLERALEVHVHA